MKAQKNNGKSLYLKKTNSRWKWMSAATAATATGVTTAHAVTINLTNNYISGVQGNHLNADLTGDGHPDLTIANAFNRIYFRPPGNYYHGSTFSTAGVRLNGVSAYVHINFYEHFGYLRLGSKGLTVYHNHYYSSSLTGSIPILFNDLRINGGAPTTGLLEVTVAPSSGVQLDSFTYISNTPVGALNVATVPDGGSSLALLAMGASGVLALRRRWKAT